MLYFSKNDKLYTFDPTNGTNIDIEVTVEYTRQRAQAKVVKSTFFNPSRKKAIIDA